MKAIHSRSTLLDELSRRVVQFEPGAYCPWEDLAARWPRWRVIIKPLEPGYRGLTGFDQRTIWLEKRLTPAEARATLAHELVHVELRHRGPQTDIVESAVEQIAARRLITQEQLEVGGFAWGDQAFKLGREEFNADNQSTRAAWASLTRAERRAIRARLRDGWADCWIA